MSNLPCKLSFELFPTNKQFENNKISNTIQKLKEYNPSYISVTFGAGGSESYKNSKSLIKYLRESNIEVVPHLTCFHLNKPQIFNMLQYFISLGINKLIIVRGDIPKDIRNYKVCFNYAYQLIDYIRQISGDYFHITVAAYPEFYPESKTLDEDIDNLKQKIDAGANHIITQYFYSIDAFYHFQKMCIDNDIKVPITAGIMPIANYQKLKKFSSICQADIPKWLDKRLAEYQYNSDIFNNYSCDIVTKLCYGLIQMKIHGLHFYTLNQAEASENIIKKLLQ
ncbi:MULTISPECIES: methylenetetrahydrofolate reductase [unclassified Francisella]|uniref:methylenetetrahydrofolate reductase n=1 Tax=unclassified Francisella TaxID=2610885 RepID=UPI002E2F9710|nr:MULTISPECIES: methylenetetrahydrofolate reductase [unclassified Francisella]MED7818322.1 methylenetetrahydrofolate reductase [Francisella sp. 19S2-4]MED7829158.1 methylenetetrahydrofolate reductase [Francisella sp. 19S2-10]